MKLWQKNLGSSLMAASLALLGSSAALAAAGASKAILLSVAIIGAVMGVVGVFFSHLFSVDQAAAVAAGAAIDATRVPPVGSLPVIQPNSPVPTSKP